MLHSRQLRRRVDRELQGQPQLLRAVFQRLLHAQRRAAADGLEGRLLLLRDACGRSPQGQCWGGCPKLATALPIRWVRGCQSRDGIVRTPMQIHRSLDRVVTTPTLRSSVRPSRPGRHRR